jgi:GDPmannose 4,6-dehydratase
MAPKSPYGVSKLYSYWMTKLYRDSYGIFASNGILFNHESPRRGETFVTRKITRFLVRKKIGAKGFLHLGNINSQRDWGHAKDYVEMQWKILQHNKPEDYIIATGETHSVKDFIEECCRYLKMKIVWIGKGKSEKGYWIDNGKKKLIIKVDKKYFRPLDIDYLRGDPKKAFKELNFRLKYTFKMLVKDMLDSDMIEAQREHNSENLY